VTDYVAGVRYVATGAPVDKKEAAERYGSAHGQESPAKPPRQESRQVPKELRPESKAGQLPDKSAAKAAPAVGKDGEGPAAESSGGDGQLALDIIVLPARGALGNPKIRDELGLGAEQVKKLREISAAHRAEFQKLGQQAQKLSPEERERIQTEFQKKSSQIIKEVRRQIDAALTPEQLDAYRKLAFQTYAKKLRGELWKLTPDEQKQKRFEFREKSMRIAQDVRPQIEALLTPQQLTALKDIVLGPWAVGQLLTAQGQEEIGLSEQQKAALKRVGQDAREKHARFGQDMLDILTPQQQEKLRAEVDRRGW